MERVLVTGPCSHVGGHLVRALLEADREVVALLRPAADARALAGLPIARRYGDVRDRESVLAAAEGCDVIFHAAPPTPAGSRSPSTASLDASSWVYVED